MDGQMLPYYAFQTPDVEQSITPTEQKQEKNGSCLFFVRHHQS